MRLGILALLTLAGAAAAQLPVGGYTGEVLFDPAPPLSGEEGALGNVTITVRYALAGGLCGTPAAQPPPGTAALTFEAVPPEGVAVRVPTPERSFALACAERVETFELAVTAPPGDFGIPLFATVVPSCTAPCGLEEATGETSLRVVATAKAPATPPPLTNTTVTPQEVAGPRADASTPPPPGPPFLPKAAAAALLGLVAVAVVVAVVGRIS